MEKSDKSTKTKPKTSTKPTRIKESPKKVAKKTPSEEIIDNQLEILYKLDNISSSIKALSDTKTPTASPPSIFDIGEAKAKAIPNIESKQKNRKDIYILLAVFGGLLLFCIITGSIYYLNKS